MLLLLLNVGIAAIVASLHVLGIIDSGLWATTSYLAIALVAGFVLIVLSPMHLNIARVARYVGVVSTTSVVLASLLLARVWHLYDYSGIGDFAADVVPSFLRSAAQQTPTHQPAQVFDYGSPNGMRIAYVEYLETDFVREEIRDFIERKDRFVPISGLLLARIVPWREKLTSLRFALKFGHQIHLLKGFCGGAEYHLLARSSFGKRPTFAKLIPIRLDARDDDLIISADEFPRSIDLGSNLEKNYRLRTFGFNNGDVNGDGFTDFVMQNRLYLGTQCDRQRGLDLLKSYDLGAESIFLPQAGPALIASLDDGRLPQRILLKRLSFKEDRLFVSTEVTPKPELGLIASIGRLKNLSPYFVLSALSDIDGDNAGELLVVQKRGFTVFFSADSYAPATSVGIDIRKYLGSTVSLSNLKIGGMGDYDGDSTPDFWLVGQSVEAGQLEPLAMLFSGGAILTARSRRDGVVDGGNVVLARLRMAAKASRLRGLANMKVNPLFAQTVSVFEADFDKDDVVDFTFTSHYELGMSGTLYVIPGTKIRSMIQSNVPEIGLEQCGILRMRAPLGARLATKPRHYANHDLNGDGYTDIVIAASGDGAGGINAGAVYLIDGEKISAALKRIDCR